MSYTEAEWTTKLRYRLDDHGTTQIFEDLQLADILLECVRVEGYDGYSSVDDKFVNLILLHAASECWYSLSKHYAEAYATAQGSKQKFSKQVGSGALSVSFEESDLESLKENSTTAFQNGKASFEAYLELKRNLLTERQPEASMSSDSQVSQWGSSIKVTDMGEDNSDWSDNTKIKIKF